MNFTVVKLIMKKEGLGAMIAVWTEINLLRGGEIVEEVRFSSEKLAALLSRRGLSDYKVAEMTGISRTMIFYMRKGQRTKVSAAILTKIANALEIDISELMTGDNTQLVAASEVPEAVRQLAKIAGKLSGVRQEELVRIAEALEKLEREQAKNPIPDASLGIMLGFLEELRKNGANNDTLASVEAILRSISPSRLTHLGRSSAQDGDDVVQDN